MATTKQLDILHHTLGVTPERREPFRNHYLAGPGHYAMPDLEALEAAGHMKRGRPPSFCRQSDVVFYVTDAGQAYALENLPEPPKRTRYGDFIDADSFDSFADFLGINKPKYETRLQSGMAFRYEHRMLRIERGYYHFADVVGEWKPTKKEAKASYKKALKRSNESQRPALKEKE